MEVITYSARAFASIRGNECKMHNSVWYIVDTQEMVITIL